MNRKVSLIAPGDDRVYGNSENEGVGEGEWKREIVPTEFIIDIYWSLASISVPSRVVQQLLEKKKNMHEDTLQEMKEELIFIQKKWGYEFKVMADRLIFEIEEIRWEIQDVWKNFETDIKRFNVAERQTVNARLTSLLAVEKSLIDEFHVDLRKNEEKRTVTTRKTFKKFRKKLRYIAYVPPGSLKIPTEEEIEDYNGKIIRNYVICEKLYSMLTLSTKNLESEVHDWLEGIKILRE